MLVNYNGVETLYYGYTDNQGSLIALTNESGSVVEKYAYDPWGARRDPANWQSKDTRTSFITNRGYTGHEHLDAFGIINMNGRVYDPLTTLFFSPDPFVQAPGNWLNYNRYGYCMNNPTRYTDPSGYKLADKNSVWYAEGYLNWMGYSGGGGGSSGGGGGSSDGGMGQNMWNSYVSVRQDGWTGTYSDFSVEYDKNPDSKGGHWVAETVTNYGYTESKGNTYFWSQTNTEVRYVSNGSQSDRPDSDGKLTFSEARDWWRNGKGESLMVSINSIDLSKIHVSDFGTNTIKSFNLLDKKYMSSLNDGLVYGNIVLEYLGNNKVMVYNLHDIYDFDIKSWSAETWKRNVETIGGNIINGVGVPYIIWIYGKTKIKP